VHGLQKVVAICLDKKMLNAVIAKKGRLALVDRRTDGS
jgi:hypothetical protein